MAYMDETTTKFSRNGLLTGGLLILTEFILLSLFYAKADPVLFDGTVPHKFIFYIEFVLVVIIFSIVRTSEGLYEEVAVNAKSLSDFNLNIGRMFGFGIFASGCYILYYLLLLI